MNIGRFQVLYWPRWKVAFYRPTARTRDWGMYRVVYRWVIYLWPIEVRCFRRSQL